MVGSGGGFIRFCLAHLCIFKLFYWPQHTQLLDGGHLVAVYLQPTHIWYYTTYLPPTNTTRSFSVGFSLWADFIRVLLPSWSLRWDCFLIPLKKSAGLCMFADAAAAEELGPGGRNRAGKAGWGSGCSDQLHWPNHHANRKTHLPHEETAVALAVQQAPSLRVLLRL